MNIETRAGNVFISYSHADSAFVGPVVSLLRATRSVVFRDADTIRPGKRWRLEIESALQQSDLVVVFWCHHSGASSEVAAEFERAIALQKDVLPVLLDRSPLPSSLQQYQCIDFKEVAGPSHERPANTALVRTSALAVRAPLFAIGAVAVVFAPALWLFWRLFQTRAGGPPGIEPTAIILPLLLAPIAVLGVLALARTIRRRRNVAESTTQSSLDKPPTPAQERIAEALQERLVERLRSRGVGTDA